MKIETKYNLGDHIMGIYTQNDEVCLYDDFIGWISLEEDGITYGLKESYQDFKEKDLFLYEDNENIMNKIKEELEKMRNKPSF